MNKWIGVGRLTSEVECRFTQSGKCVASFTLAINEGYGEKKSTIFIPCVAWEKLGETCGNNLTKGQKVLVEGRFSIRSYEGNDGQKRRIAEIVAQSVEFLEPKKQEQPEQPFGGQTISEEPLPF